MKFPTLVLSAFCIFLVNGKKDHEEVGVVGGTPAQQGQIPYQVFVVQNMPNTGLSMLCGGTIYDAYNIITAAHCVFDQNGNQANPSNFAIYAGSIKVYQGYETGAAWIQPNQNYNPKTFENDICVIRLLYPLPTNDPNIQPLALAPYWFQPSGSCLVSGWGSTVRKNSPTSDTLLMAWLSIDSGSDCKDDPNQFICAGGNGKNACTGDSGGPLACVYGNQYVLAGVVSHGPNECGSSPGYYTRITTQGQWILNVVSS